LRGMAWSQSCRGYFEPRAGLFSRAFQWDISSILSL
jgi:hypothetical protein